MIYAENILICILIPLLISLLFIEGRVRMFVLSFCFGMIICLLSAYISGFIDITAELGAERTAVYISPIVEEVMKMLPVVFCVFVLKPQWPSLLSVAVGIGSGFATFENCCYILSQGADKFSFIMIRGLSVGIMHVVSILVMALGLLLVKRFEAVSFASVVGSLSLSVTFHGLYNLLVSRPGLSSYIGYVLPSVTAMLLYFPYKKNSAVR